MTKNKVLIITGPTASGKTQLSEMLQPVLDGEIINADVGQFYKPLSIGTAKPDLSSIKYKHHLFDLIDVPQDLSVVKYRQIVQEKIDVICKSGKTPIIVGGSLFYIKSLFYPPAEFCFGQKLIQDVDLDKLSKTDLWELLKKIDPVRAAQIHKNDAYRIRRALDIWVNTGQKPSEYKPIFSPFFNALIIFLSPSTKILNERIHQRTGQMLNLGWIDEAKSLIDTEWENFVKIKGIIGYSEIIEWLKADNKDTQMSDLISKIQIQTTQYAKRQRTFWRSFANQLNHECDKKNYFIKTIDIFSCDEEVKQMILQEFICHASMDSRSSRE